MGDHSTPPTRPTWRQRAAAVLAELDRRLPASATEREVRRAVREAYPWGERSMYPYEAWRIEAALFLRRRGIGVVAEAPPITDGLFATEEAA